MYVKLNGEMVIFGVPWTTKEKFWKVMLPRNGTNLQLYGL